MWVHLLLLSSLSGTVTDEKGSPIEGAVVVLLPADYRDEPLTGASDAKGRFEVAIESPGTFRVEAHAEGYVPFRARDVDPSKPLEIVLRRGGERIAGVVRDGETLEAIPGAIVETRTGEAGTRVSTAPRLGIVEAVSNERGEFNLEGLEKKPYSVSASAPGYGRTQSHDAAPGETVELYLFPGSGVYGRLLDEKGNPVEGALVSVENEDRMRRGGPPPPQRSDAEGRFALLGLEAGQYRLFARHDELAPAVHDFELARESDAEVEIVLGSGITLNGRLVDENDEPVKGEVSLRALDGGPVGALLRSRLTAETDAEGVFSLASVPAGDHTISVEARGYGAKHVEVPVSGRAKEEDLGDIVLETGLTVSGKVVGDSGAPIAGATVNAFPSFRSAMMAVRDRIFEAETDGEGRFVLAGLSEGVYNVNAYAPGFGSSKPAVAESGDANVLFTLKRTGSIRGTVVDPKGRPVESFRAIAQSSEQRGFGGFRVEIEEGVFLLDTVAEGEYVVEIVARDFLPEVISSVRVTAGNVSELGTIRLRRGGRIEGTVVNSSEEAVPGATVQAIAPGFRPYDFGDAAVTTDRLGRFRIEGLADEKVEILASHPSYAETRLEGVAIDSASGASEIQVVLRRGGSVEGYVRGRDPADVAGRMIRAMSRDAGPRASWDSASAQTSGDGYFHIDHLPPGRLSVALVQVEPTTIYTLQSREVEVREGETAYIEFHSRRIVVHGQVRRGGAPLPGAAIALSPQSSGMSVSVSFGNLGPPVSSGPRYLAAVAGEDGYYELLVDEPGEYRLSASTNGVGLPSRTVAILDVESFSLDLDFGGALASGRIVDKETEAPVPGAFVTARPSKHSSSGLGASLQVGPDGVFELELEPGEFEMTARADGYASTEKKVTLGDGARADIIFALSPGLYITGRIVDANGRGLGNVRVMSVEDVPDIATPPLRMGFAMTIPDGTFRLDDLARGRYNLMASSAAGFAFLPSVVPGTEDLELALLPGGKLEVLVVDAEGSPIAKAVVGVVAIEGRKVRGAQGATDDAGRLELDVPRGNLTIKAGILDGPEALRTIAVSESAPLRVQIALAQAASSLRRR